MESRLPIISIPCTECGKVATKAPLTTPYVKLKQMQLSAEEKEGCMRKGEDFLCAKCAEKERRSEQNVMREWSATTIKFIAKKKIYNAQRNKSKDVLKLWRTIQSLAEFAEEHGL